ncbi:hypothetical protein EG329_005605 [Mollisiaceae sp. DMI_Dod_QoI]|nr:hypothetical protein EG329_005605 [Helotiales sp. DMI_Dod_QoI]
MCTINYIENSNWGPYADLYLYDHTCSLIKVQAGVPRAALGRPADFDGAPVGWDFNSELPEPVWIYVATYWTGLDEDNKLAKLEVGLGYNGVGSVPLRDNRWGLAAWDNFQGEDGSGTWSWWRGQFECSNG